MRISREEGNPARLSLNDDGRQALIATIKHVDMPLYNREFVCRLFWWKDASGAYYFGTVSVDDIIDYGVSTKTARGFNISVAKLEPWGEIGEDGIHHQCRIEYTQVLDAGGFLPGWIVNSSVPSSLGLVEEARLAFNRDDQVDLEERSRLVTIMGDPANETYTSEEFASLKLVQDLATEAEKTLTPIKSPSNFVKMKVSVVERKREMKFFKWRCSSLSWQFWTRRILVWTLMHCA